MKNLILICFFLFVNFHGFAQADSATFGISANLQGQGLYLSKLNVPDGNVTRLSAQAVSLDPGGFGRTIDPLHQLYYYLPGEDLLVLDLATGEALRQVRIQQQANTSFMGAAFNYKDSTLYGIVLDDSGSVLKLASLDPFSGMVSTLSDSSLASSFSVFSGTTLDPFLGIFYFVTLNGPDKRLIGADLKTGRVVSAVVIGMAAAERFGPMEFNCGDSILYGLAGNYIQGRKLGRIDPVTGELKILSRFNVADTVLNEFATIDPFGKVFYFEAADHTYRGVDLKTGDLVSMVPVIPPQGSYFTGFQYNHNCFMHPPSSVEAIEGRTDLNVFPNPVSDRLNIRSRTGIRKAEIIDLTGRILVTSDGGGEYAVTLDLSTFREGLYFLRISLRAESRTLVISRLNPGSLPGN